MRSYKMLFVMLLIHSYAVASSSAMHDDLTPELEALLESTELPSLAVAVILDGELRAAGASGVRKRGAEDRVTIDDKYHIGSCTKSITAVLAATLVEAGKITWETTLGQVFHDVNIHPAFAQVTLKQLLSNKSGCPTDINHELWSRLWEREGTASQQRMQLVEGILSKPPEYTPGTETRYSNAGFAIAGAMLERVTETSFERLLREKVFLKLGMESAGFGAPATLGKIDQPYGHNPNPVEPDERGDNPPAIAPAGTVHCSVLDFARYAAFHLGQQTALALKPETLAFLHEPEMGYEAYWMGWTMVERDWAGGTALTHAGSNTMFYAIIWIAPERNFAVVALCNSGGNEAFLLCDAAASQIIKKYLPLE